MKEQKLPQEFLFFISYWGHITVTNVERHSTWFPSRKRKRSTLGWFQLHPHGGHLWVYFVNELLVCQQIRWNETKVISIWQRHMRDISQLVTFVRLVLQFLKDRVKHKKKNNRTEWVSLKDTTPKSERVRSPRFCFYNSSGMSVKLVEIVPNVFRQKVSLKGAINQCVWNIFL